MSVLFNMIPCSYKRFNVSTCETLLQKIPVDAQSLIQRKEIHVKEIEEDISKTLQNPEKSQMRIAHTVEVLNLIDENNMINLLKYIIYFCEVVDRHLPFLESQSDVPPDMKEIIASLCYIASRYGELPDLGKLLSQFSRKYGTEFITNAAKLKPDCGVKEQIIEWLSVPKPPAQERNRLLKEIADQFNIVWHEDMVASDVEEQNKLPEKIAHNQFSTVGMKDSMSHDNMQDRNYHMMSVLYNMIPCSYKRFNVSTCETLLKKIAVDAQSLIERKEIHVKEIEEDISKTLQNPEKSEMRIAHTVEVLNLIDENNMINLLKYIIYFCEVVDRHLPFLESKSEVPPDMKEIIASLCYIGSRYGELPDFNKLLSQFSRKYGSEFITNAAKLKPDCGVKEQIIEWLAVPKPPAQERNRLLKEIADQFNIDWHEDMAASDVEDRNKVPETIADNQFSIVGMQESLSHDNIKTVKT
ncbi:uncharacterized protein LOC123889254 [Trifolium pratense]|nr:uncharacterized protein LOC123889254 [Trifolium pratense]